MGIDGVGSDSPVIEKKKEVIERTDDPVRMYLREMGAVELLSREGEIAIAKIGDPTETEPRAELATDEHHRVLEGRDRGVALPRPTDDAHPNLRMAQVGGRLDLRHGGEADPWIGNLALEHRTDLLAEQLVEAFRSLTHRMGSCRR